MTRKCDLRIQSEHYLPIPYAESMESFKRYLEETRLDPIRNTRLTAPPFLKLDLENAETPGSSVNYFLTKMDFRRELNRRFSGHELRYSDIDGGDAWGRQKHVIMVIAENEQLLSTGPAIGAMEALIGKASA